MKDVVVRPETAADHPAVRAVVTEAFETDAEARLVDALRGAAALTSSLVALVGPELVGHIAFSPVTIQRDGHVGTGIGLAPVAVRPAYQRRGVGTALIERGLNELRLAGHRLVFVLGSADYYPRFGFGAAHHHGARWEHDAPPEAFMVLALAEQATDDIAGVVRYHPAFDTV